MDVNAELEKAQSTRMKIDLLETTNSAGWQYITRFAETIIRELDRSSIDEEDDIKATSLRHDARGARKFKDALFHRIEVAKSFQEEPEHFLDVTM